MVATAPTVVIQSPHFGATHMAVSRKAKPSGAKRLATGVAVVGAFVAGAIAHAKRDKLKSAAKKAGRKVKSGMRRAGSAALNKAADLQDRVLS
jgi:hypothetical protein